MEETLYTVSYLKQFKSGNLKGLTVPCTIHNHPYRPIRLIGTDCVTDARFVLSSFVWTPQVGVWSPASLEVL